MPKWLDTRGNAIIAIFICDRCKMKRPIIEAMPDPNFPGLKVCNRGCADQKDPYRLPARQTERIALRFPRPDVSVAANDQGLVITPTGTEIPNGDPTEIYISTQNDSTNPQQNGNVQTISPNPTDNTST
jgi:hypothetical protein